MSDSFEPEITVLYCGHSLASEDHLSEGAKAGPGFKARFVMMPCSSKIETRYLIKLIEKGADGIVVMACPQKQCQFQIGSGRAQNRLNQARALLDEAGMHGERLGIVQGQSFSANEIMAAAKERADAVLLLGQNPMKSTR
ncbi:MAG: hydrogenase iron-sulfur subunit [Chloroflexota bacterium]|nr:hydrogenase iron-sulfur subunit [Chloroflexota bacterium]